MRRELNLNNILKDNSSGSLDLTLTLNEFFKKHYNDILFLEKAVQKLKKKSIPFQALNSYLNRLEKIISGGNKNELKDFINNYDKNKSSQNIRIYQNAKSFLKNKSKVLTISNSRTVLEFLKSWYSDNKKLEVIVSESRPMNEGCILAGSLLKEAIKATFITDSNMAAYIAEADAVIIGADQVLKNGDVVNKTGSRAAAIICRYFGKPFYVLAGSDKFSANKKYFPAEYNSNEVWNFKHKKLIIKNNYFETIENKLITKIISDK